MHVHLEQYCLGPFWLKVALVVTAKRHTTLILPLHITIHKIKNKFNLADLMTKYLSRDEVGQIMDFMEHEYKEGRSTAAPELAYMSDTADIFKSNFRIMPSTMTGLSNQCQLVRAPPSIVKQHVEE